LERDQLSIFTEAAISVDGKDEEHGSSLHKRKARLHEQSSRASKKVKPELK
jgi:hypothetical protein